MRDNDGTGTQQEVCKFLANLMDVLEKQMQEPCEDCISRAGIKKRLQEHHDFFVNAYGGFRNLPPNDKSRVDEITHCIAEVVNMPSVQPKAGHWIMSDDGLYRPICDKCGAHPWKGYIPTVEEATEVFNYCPNCGAKMQEVQE